ncbi:unnamed protein product [Rotaria sordida]|uniref:Uncharacterized protein n=1 Tax=Rotaria sordida TaxID=392033 RepID=A0A818TF54_9BILA|nr:unnamed protein product [Rotaria sordida]
MLNEIDTISSNYKDVQEEEAIIGRNIISSDNVFVCHVVLIDGSFVDLLSTYRKYLFWTPKIQESSSLSIELFTVILLDLAESIKRELKNTFRLIEEPDIIECLTTLAMFVVGNENLKVDVMHDAFLYCTTQ